MSVSCMKAWWLVCCSVVDMPLNFCRSLASLLLKSSFSLFKIEEYCEDTTLIG